MNGPHVNGASERTSFDGTAKGGDPRTNGREDRGRVEFGSKKGRPCEHSTEGQSLQGAFATNQPAVPPPPSGQAGGLFLRRVPACQTSFRLVTGDAFNR